jgi:hypothetical protein
MPPGIRRVRRRPEWFHVETQSYYCWKDGEITKSEFAEPRKPGGSQ